MESRGPLSADEFDRIRKFLKQEGRFITTKDRVHVCYSNVDILHNKNTQSERDIRAKVTNGIPEMVIKIGKWGASEAREEISVKLQKGEFANLIRAYAALGYLGGIIAFRKTEVYEYEGIEFSLVNVPGHSYFFEAEIMVTSKEDGEPAKKKIKEVCIHLGLTVFTDKDFLNYVNKLNKEANTLWEFKRDGIPIFKNLFNIE